MISFIAGFFAGFIVCALLSMPAYKAMGLITASMRKQIEDMDAATKPEPIRRSQR